MKLATTRSILAAALLASLATPAAAQYSETTEAGYADRYDTLRTRLRQDMEEQMGRMSLDYWEPRLNAYKVRIDGIFSSRDLSQLNELRVRFAILVEELRKKEEQQRQRYAEMADTAVYATSVAAADTVAPAVYDEEMEYAEEEVGEIAVAVPEEDEIDPAEAKRRQEEWRQQMEAQQREWEAEQERKMDEQEAALARGEAIDDMEGYRSYQHMMEFPSVSKWLARGYRSQLDVLTETVMADLASFADTLEGFTQRFMLAHAGELALVPEMRSTLQSYSDVKSVRRMTSRPLTFRARYATEIEPYLLLYNGEGLQKLLGPVAGSSSITSSLPDRSILQQNAPNPATTSTTISYTLPEASAETTLRVFNTRGEALIELKEGAREAGTHQVKVDLSALPSGSYVYQLATKTAKGDQVSAKVLQVRR